MNGSRLTDFWLQRWQDGVTPWDLGCAHPRLPRLVELACREGRLPDAASILEPGCGGGHDSFALASLGFRVLGLDLSEVAVSLARKKYDESEYLKYRSFDVTKLNELGQKFDVVFDRALFCAFPPDERDQLIDRFHETLKEGGIFMSICVSETFGEIKGPPYIISVPEIEEKVAGKFSLVAAEEWDAAHSCAIQVAREVLMIWRKVGNA